MIFAVVCYVSLITQLVAKMTTGALNSQEIPGSDILGVLYTQNHDYTANWMKELSDDTPLEHINIPGTHDAAAWNYTGPNNEMFNCQNVPLLQQLDAGSRLLDLRFGYSSDHDKLVFYHGPSLLSPTTTVQDVISGLHRWLQLHPTETLLLSMKVDNGPTDAALQQIMYDLIATEPGKQNWSQLSGELGTLGQVRGKAVLLRRFDWSALSTTPNLPGIDVSPSYWADNGLSFTIDYSPSHRANIEDYYKVPDDDGLVGTVDAKFNATAAQIERAVQSFSSESDEGTLWISFASAAGYNASTETIFPKPTAVGDGTLVGVNQRLYAWLQNLARTDTSDPDLARAGRKRLGAILLDFLVSVDDLVPLIIQLNHPHSY